MKRILMVSAIILFTAVYANADDIKSVTIKNETGYSINNIYFSPSAFDDWEEDLLDGNELGDGEEIEINLDREIDKDEVLYDLQAVDEDNDYYTMYEVDVTEMPVVSITMDAYDGGDYEDYDNYDYEGYESGYDDGYSEGYKQGYIEAFRDAYLEGFKAAMDTDLPASPGFDKSGLPESSNGWR